MKVKAVLFDLDDTLYPEIDFVKSGFGAVAGYLSHKHNLTADCLLAKMLDTLQREGRGKIFDHLLDDLGLNSEEEPEFLIELYRSHQPDIRLYDDALPTLERLRHIGIRLGIITDGLASVQRNKTTALALENLFDVITYSDELGRECWKPSTTPFKNTLELLQFPPSEAVYVGNDPTKDFLGPKHMGMLTIQVKRERQQNSILGAVSQAARAKHAVGSLLEILPIIEEKY